MEMSTQCCQPTRKHPTPTVLFRLITAEAGPDEEKGTESEREGASQGGDVARRTPDPAVAHQRCERWSYPCQGT